MGKIKLNEKELSHLVHQILERKNKHVSCERCDWDWDITADDEDPYLCHMCGHRNDSKSKKRLKEQDVDEPNQFREIDLQDILKQHTQNIPQGPIKILFDKLHNKELLYKFMDLEVFFVFDMFSQGGEFSPLTKQKKYDSTDKYVSASVRIDKILYKGIDVKELVVLITNNGGYVKRLVVSYAYDRLGSLSKNLGLQVGQIKVRLF